MDEKSNLTFNTDLMLSQFHLLTGDEFSPAPEYSENASYFNQQSVPSNYYSFSKDPLQASNEIIEFVGNNSKKLIKFLKDHGLN